MVAIPPTHPPTTATTAHPQPPPRPTQTPIAYDLARTQQPHATPARPSAAPPPRLGHTNGGFYYHRRPTTACRRRVTPLWSQFPPHTHPQPPTLRPSNNAAPRTPRATPIHNLTTAAFADATSTPPAPTGGFTTIDTSPRRVAGVSHPYGRNSPHAPTHNRHHGPPKRRLPMTWHAHNNHTPPLHAHPRLRRRDSATPTGGFTTIDTPPRCVAGVSQPYGRNSPHAPTHNHQPCARATTQHPAHPAPRPYTTSPPQHSQTPPRHH